MMRKLILGCLLAGAVAVPNTFALPMVTFTDGPGSTGGGEFTAQTTANGTFLTFCLEYTESLGFGPGYYYEISQSAKYNGPTLTLDPLSRPTAWLYLQFRNESLGTFGSTYSYSHTEADANDLQRAFWFLEGESGGVNNYYAQLAVSQAGPATVDNDGFYGVAVMNVWAKADGTGARQDQLILTVPDGGTTLTLLGLSMGLVAMISRRVRTQPLS